MRNIFLAVLLLFPFSPWSQPKNPQAKEDITVHRKIAAAHEKAARCLESGKSEKECHAHLATDCKEIAIGKYCGMRHRH